MSVISLFFIPLNFIYLKILDILQYLQYQTQTGLIKIQKRWNYKIQS